MKAITTFVSGLLLSALLLLPTSVRAAELQPFFTLKTSSINTLVSVAERFAGMAGAADAAEFRDIVNTARNIRGVDPNGIFGVAAVADDTGGISAIVLLPITDLWRAEIPGRPEVFDSIRPFLVRRGENRFDIMSPIGTYVALQRQGYLVITPEGFADQIPADARTLFADLEQYTLGFKLDLEKVEFETLESTLFGPLLLMTMMQNPEMATQLENVLEIYRELYNEFAVVAGGIAINPQTADVELSGFAVAREGSEFGRSFAGYRQLPTIFSGFRGTSDNTVFSFGDSSSQPQVADSAVTELSKQQWEAILEGFLDQIAMEDESGELVELAESAIESIRNIFEAEARRGAFDYALSLNADGTLLFAFDTVSLAEIQKLAELAAAFATKNASEEARALMTDNLNQGYATVEGFSVSRIQIPVIATVELFAGPAPDDVAALRDLTLGVYWAVKGGDKQAIAVAIGLDSAKAEQTFKAALAQTRTAVPVQRPNGVFSLAGLGKLLQQTVDPIVAKVAPSENDLATFRQVAEIFASAGSDATITLDAEITSNRMSTAYRISGRAIETIISVVRLGIEQDFGARPAIQAF